MDQNIWCLAQFIMWAFGIQTTLIIAAFGGMWVHFNKRFDKMDSRFDRIETDIKEMRTSLNRLEGAFYNRECCMLKEDRQKKKAK